MKTFRSRIITLFCLFVNKLELYLLFLLKTLKSKVVKYSRKQYQGPDFSRFHGFTSFVNRILLFPFNIFYWFYIAPSVYIGIRVYKIFYKLFKRKPWFQEILKLFENLQYVWDTVKLKFLNMEIVELFIFCTGAFLEIFLTLVWPYQSKLPEEKTISLHELSELVAYEELEQEANAGEAPVPFRRSVRAMHNFVPLNPFRATVRIHKSQAAESYREDLVESESSVIGAENTGLDSPASFPPTPFSRAYVMNRASERVVSLMFAARDRLRLEAQSVSRDEYSRMVATEARTSGQYAVFDSRQTSNGIALTCGNHCAVKTGKGLCCSTRSMIAIHPNTYVYLELSITVSSAQVPTLGIGFTSIDCPLNVMVGSWPESIGLYNDGQVLLGSHWYQTENQKKIEAGSTVGMLVYIPKQGSSIASTSHDEAIHVPNLEPSLAQSEITHPETTVTQLTVEENAFGGPSAINKGVVKFNINGEPIQLTAEVSKLTESLSTNENPFYPTVSLFSEDTRVWCRFCEADIVYRSRDSIQAPLGTRVYCLDGSLLLNEFQ